MDDLERITERRRQVQLELGRLSDELAELDAAERVIDRLRRSGIEPSINGKSLAGVTYTEAARYILMQNDQAGPMHYADITKIAIDHGFKTKDGSHPTPDQFRRRMGESDMFVNAGMGLYELSAAGRTQENTAVQ
jgi:hypothetical protein